MSMGCRRDPPRMAPFVLMCAFALAGSGAHASSKKVLITTEPEPTSQTTAPESPLKAKVVRDGKTALRLLNEAACGNDDEAASWSAVYLRRLALPRDKGCGKAALVRGLASTDPLLRALCWRHVAVMTDVALPRWSEVRSDDPVIQAIAALAYASRGEHPAGLEGALAIPRGPATGKNRKPEVESRANHLGALALPFDDAPLSLAIAFVETRASRSVIGDGKRKRFAAEALLDTLIRSLKSSVQKRDIETGAPPNRESRITAILDTRIVGRPTDTLHAMVMTGSTSLRISALRALAAVVTHPTAGDLAASASALSAQERQVRIEGARTFLLLIKKGP